MKRLATLVTGITLLLSGLMLPLAAQANTPFANDPLQGQHQNLLSEMEEEEAQILPQVELLWRSTLMRNPTLQLALQKINEKTGQISPKEKSSWTQNMLQGLIQIGGFGGAAVAGSAAPLVGSAMLSRMTAPDVVAKRLTVVTSADLVILAREIEDAQSHLIVNYMKYRHAQAQTRQLELTLNRLQHQSRSLPQDLPEAADTLHTLIVQHSLQLQQARQAAETYRNLLVLTAGDKAVDEVDQQVNKTAAHPAPDS